MSKPTITIDQAEQEVRALMNKEQIEDRVYELAQELATKYIDKVAKENTIIDCDGNVCNDEDGLDGHGGEMWYDEVRDEVMKGLFEMISDSFKK